MCEWPPVLLSLLSNTLCDLDKRIESRAMSNLRVKPLTLTATTAAGKMVPAGVSLMTGQGGDGKRE